MPATRRRSVFGCLILGFVLLALSLYLYSPWHVHTPYQTCNFSNLEHGGALQSSVQPVFPPPVALLWHMPDEVPVRLLTSELLPSLGRAPPA